MAHNLGICKDCRRQIQFDKIPKCDTCLEEDWQAVKTFLKKHGPQDARVIIKNVNATFMAEGKSKFISESEIMYFMDMGILEMDSYAEVKEKNAQANRNDTFRNLNNLENELNKEKLERLKKDLEFQKNANGFHITRK